jgi:small subunit ribosomal protein S20
VANHKSAQKRVRQNEKRNERNRNVLSTMRSMVKKVRTAVESNDADAAKAALPEALRALTRAAGKGVIHPKQASRKSGRLTKAVNSVG